MYLQIPQLKGRPSFWSKAVWGAVVGTEVAAAYNYSAPHTALAAIAEAPCGWHSHLCWSDVGAGASGEGEKSLWIKYAELEEEHISHGWTR